VGGFVARMPRRLAARYEEEPALHALLGLSAGEPPSAALSALAFDVAAFMRAHDIRYVVMNLETTPPVLQALVDLLGLQTVAEADHLRLLAMRRER
jgi:hypothetical protein